jgi:hypothetical protein
LTPAAADSRGVDEFGHGRRVSAVQQFQQVPAVQLADDAFKGAAGTRFW